MPTADSLQHYRHGLFVYDPEVLERDEPWDAPGSYTLADWETLPEGMHCELIEGHIIMSPAPRFNHQHFIWLLNDLLSPQAKHRGDVLILSPFDTVLADDLILEPDLIYLAKDRIKQIQGWLRGAPDIVIEVVSPSSSKRDRKTKFELYERHAVPEYWIFDPARESADFFVIRDGRYQAESPQAMEYRSPLIAGLVLDLDALWRNYRNRPAG